MTDDDRRLLQESHDTGKRIERYLWGTDDEVKRGVRSRAENLDAIIFGIRASKMGYRIVQGVGAFLILAGGAWAVIRGLK